VHLETIVPRWAGRRVVVVAPGPSLTAEVAEALRGEIVIAINDAWRMVPWAAVLYACDGSWWRHHNGVPEFAGEKWSSHSLKPPNDKTSIADLYGLRVVAGESKPGFSTDPSRIRYAANSGFQAVNLAILWGAAEIILVGFDMRVVAGKQHFFGSHPKGLKRGGNYPVWCRNFAAAAKTLPPGIRILNATPGSALRCFPAVDLSDALRDPAEKEHMDIPPLYIEIPAWGRYYVDIACRYTVPAALASLADSPFRDVTWLIHTDDEAAFRQALGDGAKIRFLPLAPMGPIPSDPRMPRLPANYWDAFKKAHKDAIAATPRGGIVTLLNSDIVVSRECFSVVAEQMIGQGKKTVVSVGVRTQIETDGGPPVGADAETLFRWIWGHRHPLTDGMLWGHGHSRHPTVIYFDDGAGNVSLHSWHLTPMFIRRDRDLRFLGTIDDDLLGSYRDDEIGYIADGEVAFCEISPTWKTHGQGPAINVPDILAFWRRRVVRPHYMRNFRRRLRILGQPAAWNPVVAEIVAGLDRAAAEAPPPMVSRVRPMRRLPVRHQGERPGAGNQDPAELVQFLALVKELGVKSYLEIGSRNGYSLWRVMQTIGQGGLGLSIDLSENRQTEANLRRTVADLRTEGLDVEVIFGNSRDPDVIARARKAGPFDLVLIDADHRYDGVAADFSDYAPLGRVVALHDIAAPDGWMSDGHPNEVGRFWREIKSRYAGVEIVTPGACMGFGVLLNGVAALAEAAE